MATIDSELSSLSNNKGLTESEVNAKIESSISSVTTALNALKSALVNIAQYSGDGTGLTAKQLDMLQLKNFNE